MPAKISYEPGDIFVLRISGVLRQAELDGGQEIIAAKIDEGSKPRVLVLLEGFKGWERGADWNDLDFMVSHGDGVAKIAIVAEPQWETSVLAFTGAGMRKTPVKFFRPNEAEKARAWLRE